VRTFLTAVKLMKPEVVLMENVPALMWRGRAFLEELMSALASLGYESEYALLHAEAYGVPQLRRRLIVQGTRSGPPVWPAPTHKVRDPAFPRFQPTSSMARLPRARTVRDAIGDLPRAQATDIDELSPLSDAKTDYQRWCRGFVDVSELTGPTRAGTYDSAANGGR
jgi:DNA (cytosine-5)-methyltransferase 1